MTEFSFLVELSLYIVNDNYNPSRKNVQSFHVIRFLTII